MRVAMLLLLGACLVSPITTSSARAATLPPLGIENGPNGIVEVAGPRCGRNAHYVRGHKARNGRWIKGQCVRDRRR